VDVYIWSSGRPLAIVGMILLDQFDLPNRLNLNQSRIRNFLEKVEDGYDARNPYHNSTHGADVTQRFATLVNLSRLREWAIGDSDLLAALLAALLHDFLHPGTSNSFQVQVGSVAAQVHNGKHVLENHAAMKGLLLLKGEDNDTNFLSTLPRAKRREVRETVVDLILATDMSEHFTVLSAFKAKVLPKIQARQRAQSTKRMKTPHPRRRSSLSWAVEAVKSSVFKNPESQARHSGDDVKGEGANWHSLNFEEKRLLLKMLLKCADVGHVTLPQDLHTMWVQCLQEEFYRQGDFECTARMPISFLCDRNRPRNGPAFGENQLGFLDIICVPMYTSLVDCFPLLVELLSNLLRNRRTWEVDAMKNGKDVFVKKLQKLHSSVHTWDKSVISADRPTKSLTLTTDEIFHGSSKTSSKDSTRSLPIFDE